MAEVIRLEDRLMRAPPKPLTGPSAPLNAQILLFTGIRYERLDVQAKPISGTRKKH